jgi:hypothetical protein
MWNFREAEIFSPVFSLFGHFRHKICTNFESFIFKFLLIHYHFQMMKKFQGQQKKLEGRMQPAGLLLAMSDIDNYIFQSTEEWKAKLSNVENLCFILLLWSLSFNH